MKLEELKERVKEDIRLTLRTDKTALFDLSQEEQNDLDNIEGDTLLAFSDLIVSFTIDVFEDIFFNYIKESEEK